MNPSLLPFGYILLIICTSCAGGYAQKLALNSMLHPCCTMRIYFLCSVGCLLAAGGYHSCCIFCFTMVRMSHGWLLNCCLFLVLFHCQVCSFGLSIIFDCYPCCTVLVVVLTWCHRRQLQHSHIPLSTCYLWPASSEIL
jgi:hypothetical protein